MSVILVVQNVIAFVNFDNDKFVSATATFYDFRYYIATAGKVTMLVKQQIEQLKNS